MNGYALIDIWMCKQVTAVTLSLHFVERSRLHAEAGAGNLSKWILPKTTDCRHRPLNLLTTPHSCFKGVYGSHRSKDKHIHRYTSDRRHLVRRF